MGNIFTEVVKHKHQVGRVQNPVLARTDQDTYYEMDGNGQYVARHNNLEGTIFDHSDDSRPDPYSFVKFFMALGAFGIFLWASGRIVSYYALWMPAPEDFDYNYFQYEQAMERYGEYLFAADAWGLFLAFVAIIGVLTLIINDLYRKR